MNEDLTHEKITAHRSFSPRRAEHRRLVNVDTFGHDTTAACSTNESTARRHRPTMPYAELNAPAENEHRIVSEQFDIVVRTCHRTLVTYSNF